MLTSCLLVVSLVAVCALSVSPERQLRQGWDRGEGATALRPLVAAAAPGAAVAVAGSTASWAGLWRARIQHFEKVEFAGLRVQPQYALSAAGDIVSDVHVRLGPLAGWLSAAGTMRPAGSASVTLVFDDFWVGADAENPRSAPAEEGASALDALTRAIGRAAFFEGLANFPVDYAGAARYRAAAAAAVQPRPPPPRRHGERTCCLPLHSARLMHRGAARRRRRDGGAVVLVS